jgi:hypothetical protein
LIFVVVVETSKQEVVAQLEHLIEEQVVELQPELAE